MTVQETSLDNGGAVPRRSGFLAVYFDAGLSIPDDLDLVKIRAEEISRLSECLAKVIYASSISRRLGGDASREELALDKKRARRASWALKQSLIQWSGAKLPALPSTDEVRQAGAQLIWESFREQHFTHLNERLRTVATWGILQGEQVAAKKCVVKLNNEANWVSYALRD